MKRGTQKLRGGVRKTRRRRGGVRKTRRRRGGFKISGNKLQNLMSGKPNEGSWRKNPETGKWERKRVRKFGRLSF